MVDLTIFRNPACGTSRTVLALIRNSGVEPTIVDCLKTPPGRGKLVELLAAMQMPVRELLRRKGTPHDELQLDDPAWTDTRLLVGDQRVDHALVLGRAMETPREPAVAAGTGTLGPKGG